MLYYFVRYYTKINNRNQVLSEKISITRRSLFVVRIACYG